MDSPSLLVAILMLLATGSFTEPKPIPDCPTSYGDVTIPYSFGITSDYSLDDVPSLITCNHSFNPSNISLNGLVKVASPVASDCYDDSGSIFSPNTYELLQVQGSEEWNTKNRSGVCSSNTCFYAFMGDTHFFGFSSSNFGNLHNKMLVPDILDRSVENISCLEVQNNLSRYACLAANSECIDSSSGVEYKCKCLTGSQGNPYIVDGCQDIGAHISYLRPLGFKVNGKIDDLCCYPECQICYSTLIYTTAYVCNMHHMDFKVNMYIWNQKIMLSFVYTRHIVFENLNLDRTEVLNISLNGLVKVASPVGSDCYDDSCSHISRTTSEITWSMFSAFSPKFYTFSANNKFTAIGFDAYALPKVQGSDEWNTNSNRNHSGVRQFNCGMPFSSSDLKNIIHVSSVPVVLRCYPEGPTSYSTLFYISSVFMVPAIGSSWIFWRRRQKKVVNLRRSLFIRNSGELLDAMQSIQKTLSIFSAEDLKKATNDYDENNVLCEEHFGITYKGVLPGLSRVVTIKGCHAFDQCNVEVLISKLVTLSQINHTNVVKLLGCCLETQVPLVVYEFITVKSLSDYITDDLLARSLSWDIRLRIAADIAGVMAYMHYATSVPIIHGNLNSSSILLHHGYTVKVHGFALTCLECSCVRLYGRTSGFVDPDYLSSVRLTEKSDVYSFGFILAELMTGKDAMSPEWLKGEENIAIYFAGSSRGRELRTILDDRVVTDGFLGQLTEVVAIAKLCLLSSSQERPTMKEVAIALECIIIRGSRLSSTQTRASRRLLLDSSDQGCF